MKIGYFRKQIHGLREVVWVKMPVFGTGRPLQTPPSMDPDHLVTLRKVT